MSDQPKEAQATPGQAFKRMMSTFSKAPEAVNLYPTVCIAMDSAGEDGVNHLYAVSRCDAEGQPVKGLPPYATAKFQHGSREEVGVNGCTEMDLLGIVAHRLVLATGNEFDSINRQRALQAIDSAMFWLNRVGGAEEPRETA